MATSTKRTSGKIAREVLRKKNNGAKGGLLIGPSHTEGGIPVKNKSTGEDLEVEGGEIVINKKDVADPRLKEFEGKMMTNKEILSAINEPNGVAFAKGGSIPKIIKCSGKMYMYGGKLTSDYDIVSSCGCKHGKQKMEKGGQVDKKLRTINNEFNDRLKDMLSGNNKNYKPLYFGHPSAILASCGFPDLPIEMSIDRLNEKINQKNHIFSLVEIVNLPEHIANPIAVFQSETAGNNKVILTELGSKGHNIVVAIEINKSIHNKLFVNSIRSVYPKDNVKHVLKWIVEYGLMEYVQKEKFLNWLDKQLPIAADFTRLIKETTNIVNSFENPKINPKFQSGGTVKKGKQQSNSAEVAPLQIDSELNIQNSLISEINKLLDSSDNILVTQYKGHPEELLAFIQEQSTGMYHDRSGVHTAHDTNGLKIFQSMERIAGAAITLRAIEQIPDDQKEMILTAWKGKAMDPRVRKTLQGKKVMTNAGETHQNDQFLIQHKIYMDNLNIQIAEQEQKLVQAKQFALVFAQNTVQRYYFEKTEIIRIVAMISGYEKDIIEYHHTLASIAQQFSDDAVKLAEEINKHKHSFSTRSMSYGSADHIDTSDDKFCDEVSRCIETVKGINSKESDLWGSIIELNLFITSRLESFVRICHDLKLVKENILMPLGISETDINITGENYTSVIEKINSTISELETQKEGLQEFGNGGKIADQYQGKTPAEIWGLLTHDQKDHFLKDHHLSPRIKALGLTATEYADLPAKYFSDLPDAIQTEFTLHVQDGQYADGGQIQESIVSGHNLVIERTNDPIEGLYGTIRTIPENYYVATIINENGDLEFHELEENTKDIDKNKVSQFYAEGKIPEKKTRYGNGGSITTNHFYDNRSGSYNAEYWADTNAKGKWTVFSKSDKWKIRDEFEEFGLPDQESAIYQAKVMSGEIKEYAKGGIVKLPESVFYVKIEPLRKGDESVYTRILPDKAGEFIAGYVVYKDVSSTKQAGYLSKDELEMRLENKEYEIVDKPKRSHGYYMEHGGKINKSQEYTIVTPDGGYWHGEDHEPTTISQNANPTNWGTKEQATEEMQRAISFCKKAGYYTESLDYKVEDFSLATYNDQEEYASGGRIGNFHQLPAHIKKEINRVTSTVPLIVKRGMLNPITDIGQLTVDQKKELNKYVKKGILDKGKGGPYPKLKTVYALHGFDFQKDREIQIKQMFEEIEHIEPGTIKIMAKGGTIDSDTILLPRIIAEGAAWDAFEKDKSLKKATPEKLYNMQLQIVPILEQRANVLYQSNEEFRKKVNAKGEKGRDYLWALMEHWAKAWLNNPDSLKERGIPIPSKQPKMAIVKKRNSADILKEMKGGGTIKTQKSVSDADTKQDQVQYKKQISGSK